MPVTVEIVPLNRRDLGYVMGNLRPADQVEIEATVGPVAGEVLTEWHLATTEPDMGWIAREARARDVIPLAAWGFAPVTRRCWRVWMVGSRRWQSAVRPVTAHLVKVGVGLLLQRGVWRVHAHSVEGHTEAHQWMELLGAVNECAMQDFGHNGETFFQFAWTQGRLRAMAHSHAARLIGRKVKECIAEPLDVA